MLGHTVVPSINNSVALLWISVDPGILGDETAYAIAKKSDPVLRTWGSEPSVTVL